MGRWQESKWEHMRAALNKNPDLPRYPCVKHARDKQPHDPNCRFCLNATIKQVKPYVPGPKSIVEAGYDR